jgi:hypothetical protein
MTYAGDLFPVIIMLLSGILVLFGLLPIILVNLHHSSEPWPT